MPLFPNKRSLVKETVISILLLSAGFLLILTILGTFTSEAEAKTAEAVCKASVVLREKTYTEIDPLGIVTVASPLFCNTIDKKLPEAKPATRELIKRDVAKLMTSCWNQFGEGLIKDVFKEGDLFTNSCFICYTARLKETNDFDQENNIDSEEFLQYLFENPFRTITKDDERQTISYGDYLQSFGGEGKIVIGTDLIPGETYAISFGSPTDKCDFCEKWGLGFGLGAAAYTFGAVIVVVSGPVGWTAAGLLALGAASTAGVITYAATDIVLDEGSNFIKDVFYERNFPTIYLTKLSQINNPKLSVFNEEFCSIVNA